MSGSEPAWAEQGHAGWWLSPAAISTKQHLGTEASVGAFRSRLAVVQAVYNDGSRERAEAIVEWVSSVGGGPAYVERLALGNWGVVVLRPERPEALWVVVDQHLVLDPRRRPHLDVFTYDEFRACFDTSVGHERVRECPIFSDGEIAS